MEMTVATLERMSARGTLEVEHLLRLAKSPDPSVADALDALSRKLAWHSSGSNEVPFGVWADVVSAHCRNGFTGLRDLARDPKFAPFVLGLLEELHSSEALECILASFPDVLQNWARHPTLAERVVAALNLTLSFKPWVVPSASQAELVRSFLHAFAAGARTDASRGLAYCALRQVGDSGSLALISSLPSPKEPWAGTLVACKRAITKRSRAQA